MRRKYINASTSKWISKCDAEIVRTEEEIPGYAALVTIREMKKVLHMTLPDREFDLLAKGHRLLNFIPDGKHWAMTAVYDADWNVIEWYFDVTKNNGVEENGMPYFDDLYLDYVILPDDSAVVMDEEELLAALEQGEITKEDTELAYRTLEELRSGIASDAEKLTSFCESFRKYFAGLFE